MRCAKLTLWRRVGAANKRAERPVVFGAESPAVRIGGALFNCALLLFDTAVLSAQASRLRVCGAPLVRAHRDAAVH